MITDDINNPERDHAALDRANELTAEAARELAQAEECHLQCEGQNEVMRRALADARAAGKAHDAWLTKATEHRVRAEQLLEQSGQIHADIKARMTARRESGES